jgi:hypothetical protein
VKLSYEKVQPGVYKMKPEALEPDTEYAFISTSQSTSGANSVAYLFGTK